MSLPGRLGAVANGNINPCRFVKRDTSAGQAFDGRVLQAGAGEVCAGISGESTHRAPYGALNDGYHAVAGENAMVYGPGEVCLLVLGTGGATRGNRLKSDASGGGVVANGTTDSSYAIAEATGVAGDKIPVTVSFQDAQGGA